jgi:hypothetical protein
LPLLPSHNQTGAPSRSARQGPMRDA